MFMVNIIVGDSECAWRERRERGTRGGGERGGREKGINLGWRIIY